MEFAIELRADFFMNPMMRNLSLAGRFAWIAALYAFETSSMPGSATSAQHLMKVASMLGTGEMRDHIDAYVEHGLIEVEGDLVTLVAPTMWREAFRLCNV